jgi:hypothetical protein
MSLQRSANNLAAWCLLGVSVLAFTPAVFGGPLGYYGCSGCSGGCCGGCEKCPPPYCHCQERPPRIHFRCGCAKPVCDPCTLEHFGYYRTCWQPWPFPPDWSHCQVPPPGADPTLAGPQPVGAGMVMTGPPGPPSGRMERRPAVRPLPLPEDGR